MARDSSEALSKGLRIAMLTPWADLGAPADRIPSSIRPLDFRVIAHRPLAFWDWKARRTALINQLFAMHCARCNYKMHLRKEYQFEVMARCVLENLYGCGTFLCDVC